MLVFLDCCQCLACRFVSFVVCLDKRAQTWSDQIWKPELEGFDTRFLCKECVVTQSMMETLSQTSWWEQRLLESCLLANSCHLSSCYYAILNQLSHLWAAWLQGKHSWSEACFIQSGIQYGVTGKCKRVEFWLNFYTAIWLDIVMVFGIQSRLHSTWNRFFFLVLREYLGAGMSELKQAFEEHLRPIKTIQRCDKDDKWD